MYTVLVDIFAEKAPEHFFQLGFCPSTTVERQMLRKFSNLFLLEAENQLI